MASVCSLAVSRREVMIDKALIFSSSDILGAKLIRSSSRKTEVGTRTTLSVVTSIRSVLFRRRECRCGILTPWLGVKPPHADGRVRQSPQRPRSSAQRS